MYTLGKHSCTVVAGVPPASSSNSQPTRLPLQTAAIFCLYELVNSATFHFVTKFDLRHEDCIDGMARLGDESVDVVVTSPPYNLGITYGEAMHTLDTNFQRIALQAYNKREVKTIDEFRALCSQLLEKQNTCSLFDLALFNGKPIEQVVDMSKVVTAKLSADTVIRALEEKLATEKTQRAKDREYAKAKYGELLSQYRALQAQVSGPLFAHVVPNTAQ